MKRTRFTESQIIKAIKENEQGRKAEDLCIKAFGGRDWFT